MIRRRSFLAGLGSITVLGSVRAATTSPPAALTAPAGAPTRFPSDFPTSPPPTAAAAAATAPPKKARRDGPDIPIGKIPNHRQYMRELVTALADYAHQHKPPLLILARNAPELLIKEQRELAWETARDLARDPDGTQTAPRTPLGTVFRLYLKALDGLVIDGPFCGLEAYDRPTDEAQALPLLQAAEQVKREGRRVLSIDYGGGAPAAAAAGKARQSNFAVFIASDGNKRLDHIPASRPLGENPEHVTDLQGVRNWLPVPHPQGQGARADWIKALAATNYDLLAIDSFWQGRDPLTADEVKALKFKGLGSRRLVFAVLPVGKAADDRFYWQPDWAVGRPAFLSAVDPADSARLFVEYWAQEWKDVLGSYIQGIAALGFDGVLLDEIDTYRHFEDLMPID